MSKKLELVVVLIFLASCVSTPEVQKHQTEYWKVGAAESILASYNISNIESGAGLELECGGNKVPILRSNDSIQFYLSVPYNYDFSQKKIICLLYINSEPLFIGGIIPQRVPYPEESLRVNPKLVFPSEMVKRIIQRDNLLMKKVWGFNDKSGEMITSMIKPVDSAVTSFFGVKRTFNEKKKDVHYGLDLRGRTGTPIKAAAKGKIIWSGELAIPGNTIIVSHGQGLFTMYSHLSKFIARVGDEIQEGEILGEVGATGRVSGPHLHWSVIVHGNWVNPQKWLKE